MMAHTTPEQGTPARPPNTWRVCGRTLAQGCTCPPGGPNATTATAAAKRLAGELS